MDSILGPNVAAHPRSRGENHLAPPCLMLRGGSSPLTRGKLGITHPSKPRQRLIPAHAGKTACSEIHRSSRSAHPRSRGENRELFRLTFARPGSSPLTRGKHYPTRRLRRRRGLIPAHAGKTNLDHRRDDGDEAHPRSRGENAGTSMEEMGSIGSSPLTRGKRFSGPNDCLYLGLIPAHAGKTYRFSAACAQPPAHPRSRGENKETMNDDEFDEGSSPLTRGKHNFSGCEVCGDGLIPAHAGKTRRTAGGCCAAWAHPRSRGENRPVCEATRPDCGSSPLTRGKRVPRARFGSQVGLIPAHAGKTGPPGTLTCRPRAHPRSRGENVGLPQPRTPLAGSSPLTRGKHGRGG